MKTLFEKMRDNRAKRTAVADRLYLDGLEKVFKESRMYEIRDGETFACGRGFWGLQKPENQIDDQNSWGFRL